MSHRQLQDFMLRAFSVQLVSSIDIHVANIVATMTLDGKLERKTTSQPTLLQESKLRIEPAIHVHAVPAICIVSIVMLSASVAFQVRSRKEFPSTDLSGERAMIRFWSQFDENVPHIGPSLSDRAWLYLLNVDDEQTVAATTEEPRSRRYNRTISIIGENS